MRKIVLVFVVIVIVGCILSVGAYYLPPVRARVDNLRTRIVYALNPPEEAVFIPQEQVDRGYGQGDDDRPDP